MQYREQETGRLSTARSSHSHHILSLHYHRNTLPLNGGGVVVAFPDHALQHWVVQTEVAEAGSCEIVGFLLSHYYHKSYLKTHITT